MNHYGMIELYNLDKEDMQAALVAVRNALSQAGFVENNDFAMGVEIQDYEDDDFEPVDLEEFLDGRIL